MTHERRMTLECIAAGLRDDDRPVAAKIVLEAIAEIDRLTKEMDVLRGRLVRSIDSAIEYAFSDKDRE